MDDAQPQKKWVSCKPSTEKGATRRGCHPERTGRLRHLRGSSGPRVELGITLPSALLRKQATEAEGPLGSVWEHAVSASPRAQPAPAHLGPIVAEDAHHADRNSFVQTAPQSLAVEREHEGDVLLTGVSDDGVQGVVQSTCPRGGMGTTGLCHTGWWGHWSQGLLLHTATRPAPSDSPANSCVTPNSLSKHH